MKTKLKPISEMTIDELKDLTQFSTTNGGIHRYCDIKRINTENCRVYMPDTYIETTEAGLNFITENLARYEAYNLGVGDVEEVASFMTEEFISKKLDTRINELFSKIEHRIDTLLDVIGTNNLHLHSNLDKVTTNLSNTISELPLGKITESVDELNNVNSRYATSVRNIALTQELLKQNVKESLKILGMINGTDIKRLENEIENEASF